jgi:hypothetical protein
MDIDISRQHFIFNNQTLSTRFSISSYEIRPFLYSFFNCIMEPISD